MWARWALQTSQAQNGATAQQSAMNSAQSAQQSVSGVNLDQEAANMLQYQQAYQAAAQVIADFQHAVQFAAERCAGSTAQDKPPCASPPR